MEFDQPQSIFRQLADRMRDRIVSEDWKVGERIPSIREMAVSGGVNPNTVNRSYQSLVQEELIENRRGIGYFVTENAPTKVRKELKKKFIKTELPRLFHNMRRLDMSEEELMLSYKSFAKENSE